MNMRLQIKFCPFFLAATASSLFACTGGDKEPTIYYSPEPELDYGQGYVGKLWISDDCVLLLVGEGLMTQSPSDAKAEDRVIPLFRPGFTIEDYEGETVVTSPDGNRFRTNEIVTGEGGTYPASPDPRSAPVASAPDISKCGTVAFQVNSMAAGSL